MDYAGSQESGRSFQWYKFFLQTGETVFSSKTKNLEKRENTFQSVSKELKKY